MKSLAPTDVQSATVRYYLSNGKVSNQQIATDRYGQNVASSQPVKILIHGYLDGVNSFWYQPIITEYRKRGANVVAVDWSDYSGRTYPGAMYNLPGSAAAIANFITGLSSSHNIPLNRFHILGHSLGGQLAGYVGKWRGCCIVLNNLWRQWFRRSTGFGTERSKSGADYGPRSGRTRFHRAREGESIEWRRCNFRGRRAHGFRRFGVLGLNGSRGLLSEWWYVAPTRMLVP